MICSVKLHECLLGILSDLVGGLVLIGGSELVLTIPYRPEDHCQQVYILPFFMSKYDEV